MKNNQNHIILIIVFSLIFFAGCTPTQKENEEGKDVNIVLLSEELYATLDIADEIEQVDASMIDTLYNLEPGDLISSIVYMSTGAKSDEIAIFQCQNPDVAARLKGTLEARREDEINIFKDYAPGEVAKLKSAIIFTQGSYALYCVSPDSKAVQQIIDSYF